MRTQHTLARGWRFHWGEAAEAFYRGYDDSAWTPVTLPHDWAVTLPFGREHASGTGYAAGGIGWYRGHVLLKDMAHCRAFLTFGGVYKHARVWVNSHYLGQCAYGYTTFSYEITPFLQAGDNVICVRCEHEETADSRWYTGNGIYRDVTLTLTGQRCFLPDSVFAQTVLADGERAEIRVSTDEPIDGELDCALLDGQGNLLAQGADALCLPNPRLWSPQDPYLYDLRCRLMEGGTIADEIHIPFGIRTFRFDPSQGFFLNGTSLKLKGVCLHHDAGALGAAVPKDVWARRLQKLKAVGCNALRFAHHPPDPHLLDLCDNLGFLVVDEAFDEWEGCKNKWWQGHNVYPPKHFGYAIDFPQWHEFDLKALVRRDRNHPCVILWSIGNEVDYPNDPYVHPLFETMTGNNDADKPAAERVYDPNKPNAQRLTAIAKSLVAIVKKQDPSRPVTAALAFPELSNPIGLAEVLDVVGYNYKEYLYQEDHRRYPDRVLMGSENGHDPSAWRAVAQNPFLCSQFLWTGIDYLGECRGWPYRISQAGLLDLCGYEKPRYFHRKALWTREPVAYLFAGVLEGKNQVQACWKGKPGELIPVSCVTNGQEVTLRLNGRTLAVHAMEETCLVTWQIPYEEGTLTVDCRCGDEVYTDAMATPGPAVRLAAVADRAAFPGDGASIAHVELTLLDASGQVAVGDDRLIRCQLVGDAELLGMENGRPDDVTCYALPARSTYRGRAIVYLRSGHEAGELALHLQAEGLPRVVVRIQAEEAGEELR